MLPVLLPIQARAHGLNINISRWVHLFLSFFCPRSFFQQKHMLYLVGAAHIALGVPSWWRIFGDTCLHRDSSDYNDLLCGAVQIHVGTSNHLKRWPAYVLLSSVCYCSSITSVWGTEHKIFWSTADRKGLFCESPGFLIYNVSSSCTVRQYLFGFMCDQVFIVTVVDDTYQPWP